MRYIDARRFGRFWYIGKDEPETKCIELADTDWEKLSCEISQELSFAIEKNEMSAEEYLAGKGKEYRNTPFLKVYGHEGEICSVCGSKFEKITIGERSSCYCPICQKPGL